MEKSPFEKHFLNGTLRIDYFHTGDATSESVNLDKIYKYDRWAGSLVNLIDSLSYGAYYYKIYDSASGILIYSHGFDSYFKEYQVSTPAIEGKEKQFHESALVPFPIGKIIFALEKRNKAGKLEEVFRAEIDPSGALEKSIVCRQKL